MGGGGCLQVSKEYWELVSGFRDEIREVWGEEMGPEHVTVKLSLPSTSRTQ